ncbi:MAG TPA: LemA family protein [Blastocatellia bacterium]|nr:LemA family protein [Blastocatellia bacterium]
MRKRNLPSIFSFPVVAALSIWIGWIGQIAALAQTGSGGKQMKKDELYLSIARRLNAVNESPSSAIANELDTVIEVTNLTTLPDGKAEATVKERAPSDTAQAGKSIRLIFAPPAAGDVDEKWTWEQFENNRKFYPVDKLFPYTKDELGKRKQATVMGWSAFIAAINKQGEAASKTLETAKAILKADPAPLAGVKAARNALAEAAKENRTEDILNAYRELNQQTEPVSTLADTYTDLKANDAYLRLIDEFKKSVEATNTARKNYLQVVAAYNETIVRLPFSLVAYGLEFHKIDANISEDQ